MEPRNFARQLFDDCGADFVAGQWIVATLSFGATCGSNRNNCTLKIVTGSALTKPTGAVTQLEYSLNGGAFVAVPSSATLLLPASFAGSVSGSIVVRYQLGWAGSPFTPVSTTNGYSQLVQLTLQQGQP